MRQLTQLLLIILVIASYSCKETTPTGDNNNSDSTKIVDTLKADSSWKKLPLNINSIRGVATSGTTIYAAGIGTGAWVSTNKGQNWTSMGLKDTVIYTISEGGQFLGTQNFGAYLNVSNTSWKNSSNGLAPKGTSPRVYAFYQSGNKIFACTRSGLFLSTNSGLLWLKVAGGIPDIELTSITGIGGVIYLGTYGDGIYKSQDDGVNWSKSTPNTFSNLLVRGLSSDANNNVYAACDSQKVLKSSDQGNSWSVLNSGFPYQAAASSVLSTGDLLIIGTDDQGFSRWNPSSSLSQNRWIAYNKSTTTTKIFDLKMLNTGEIIAGTDDGVFINKFK